MYSFKYMASCGKGRQLKAQAVLLGYLSIPAAFAAAAVVGPLTGIAVWSALAATAAAAGVRLLNWFGEETLAHRRSEERRMP
jgi:hypothetical protein